MLVDILRAAKPDRGGEVSEKRGYEGVKGTEKLRWNELL